MARWWEPQVILFSPLSLSVSPQSRILLENGDFLLLEPRPCRNIFRNTRNKQTKKKKLLWPLIMLFYLIQSIYLYLTHLFAICVQYVWVIVSLSLYSWRREGLMYCVNQDISQNKLEVRVHVHWSGFRPGAVGRVRFGMTMATCFLKNWNSREVRCLVPPLHLVSVCWVWIN